MTEEPAMPPVVSAQEWQRARDELLVTEKQLTRQIDAVAAQRRRLPMVAFDNHTFAGPQGPVTLLDFFGDERQLAVYQFMDAGPDHLCPGCTFFTNQVTDLDGLRKAGVAWATISDMPIEQMTRGFAEHGWDVPFASSRGTSFSSDCGAEGFLLTVFLRDGEQIYRTYSTGQRGVDHLLFGNVILDLMPWGRQEEWEDSPAGWPQHPTYG